MIYVQGEGRRTYIGNLQLIDGKIRYKNSDGATGTWTVSGSKGGKRSSRLYETTVWGRANPNRGELGTGQTTMASHPASVSPFRPARDVLSKAVLGAHRPIREQVVHRKAGLA